MHACISGSRRAPLGGERETICRVSRTEHRTVGSRRTSPYPEYLLRSLPLDKRTVLGFSRWSWYAVSLIRADTMLAIPLCSTNSEDHWSRCIDSVKSHRQSRSAVSCRSLDQRAACSSARPLSCHTRNFLNVVARRIYAMERSMGALTVLSTAWRHVSVPLSVEQDMTS
jgi:hypothetical protein